jgi:hypothetical protein
VEVELLSAFQTHSNIYSLLDVKIVEQYVGTVVNPTYATKQNLENARLLKRGSIILQASLLFL